MILFWYILKGMSYFLYFAAYAYGLIGGMIVTKIGWDEKNVKTVIFGGTMMIVAAPTMIVLALYLQWISTEEIEKRKTKKLTGGTNGT